MSWIIRETAHALEIAQDDPPVLLARWTAVLSFRCAEPDAAPAAHGRWETTAVPVMAPGGPPAIEPGPLAAAIGPGAVLELEAAAELRINGRIQGSPAPAAPVALDRLVLSLKEVRVGSGGGGLSFYKNGFQSWTSSRSFRSREREMVSILPCMVELQDNVRNLPTGRPGEFASDMFCMLGSSRENVFLLAGQEQGFNQFCYFRTRSRSLKIIYDFGGKLLAPGEELRLDPIILITAARPEQVQEAYFEAVRRTLPVRLPELENPPTGWCSWYTYFQKVSAPDLMENLAEIRRRNLDWKLFVIDDGYESAVGDWLSCNQRFPEGLKPLAQAIRDQGMIPGLWLAPFIAIKGSRLYREHPEWFLHDDRGRPVRAGWNNRWGGAGIQGSFYGLDTTHPGFQAHLKEVIRTFVHGCGFAFLKLDFVYAAAMTGRAHDPSLTPIQRLKLGYDLIRREAGEGVFLLGCGSPLAAALGRMQALRIGPDVAPFWFAFFRYHLSRDPHALCTRFAIRSILNRAPMHRRFWINDPDCLLVGARNTSLTVEERMSLANAIAVTGGMVLVSGRLCLLEESDFDTISRVEAVARECSCGSSWPLDAMDREMPEILYNSAGYCAFFNFSDRAERKRLSYRGGLDKVVGPQACFEEVWEGRLFSFTDGVLDLGLMPPHSSFLCRIRPR